MVQTFQNKPSILIHYNMQTFILPVADSWIQWSRCQCILLLCSAKFGLYMHLVFLLVLGLWRFEHTKKWLLKLTFFFDFPTNCSPQPLTSLGFSRSNLQVSHLKTKIRLKELFLLVNSTVGYQYWFLSIFQPKISTICKPDFFRWSLK